MDRGLWGDEVGVQLRVSLPDQPGALARVAGALARAGADVIAVSVLEAEAGRAIDEFRLRWPDVRGVGPLVTAMRGLRGVEVLGCRRTRWLRDGRPDLDLLAALVAVPGRGIETLVDMAPAAFDADWAELWPPSRRLGALHVSHQFAHDDLAPGSMPVRAIAGTDGNRTWAYLPVEAIRSVLVVGRDEGPVFLRSELVHAERVLDLATATLQRLLPKVPASERRTELTAGLAHR
jgi:ACT domain